MEKVLSTLFRDLQNNKRIFQRRILYIAYGSNCELETQIVLSGDSGYVEAGELKKLQNEIGEVERIRHLAQI